MPLSLGSSTNTSLGLFSSRSSISLSPPRFWEETTLELLEASEHEEPRPRREELDAKDREGWAISLEGQDGGWGKVQVGCGETIEQHYKRCYLSFIQPGKTHWSWQPLFHWRRGQDSCIKEFQETKETVSNGWSRTHGHLSSWIPTYL